MWKFWFTWGIDKAEKFTPDIPHVSTIQGRLIKNAMQGINQRLGERGEAEFYTTGMTDDSVKTVLQRCAEQGYQIWKHVPPDYGSSSPFRIAVNASYYLEKYYELIPKQEHSSWSQDM